MADRVQAWGVTHPGLQRPTNQDCFALPGYRSSKESETCHLELEREGAWALVADGMGGHRAGAYASTVAVTYLSGRLHALKASSELPAILGEVNTCIHEAMFSEGGEPGMGTTIVGFWMQGKSMTVFNIGDSRAYILRHGTLTQLSMDHTPEGNSDHGYRSHRLTQSLGGTFNRIDPIPHVATVASKPGDAILLCTDGLTDLVSDQQIHEITALEKTKAASALVDAAIASGGRDNVTAVFLEV